MIKILAHRGYLVNTVPENSIPAFKTAIDHEDYLKKQDIDLLFNLMKKHIQTWWD